MWGPTPFKLTKHLTWPNFLPGISKHDQIVFCTTMNIIHISTGKLLPFTQKRCVFHNTHRFNDVLYKTIHIVLTQVMCVFLCSKQILTQILFLVKKSRTRMKMYWSSYRSLDYRALTVSRTIALLFNCTVQCTRFF